MAKHQIAAAMGPASNVVADMERPTSLGWIYNGQRGSGNAPKKTMADALFLNLWFPRFAEEDMMPRTLSVLRQFPFSAQHPGISYLGVHPVSWSEPTVLERRFHPGLDIDEAAAIAAEFIHDDYAYLFETHWDLWLPSGEDESALAPVQVKVIAHGTEFEERIYQQAGHVQVDFGVDTPFLYEEQELTSTIENRFRANVQRLIAFTAAVENNCSISGRVLWSESDENLARKLIARLQRVH
jgi:hypothetical protein